MNKYLLGFDEINRLDFEAELEELFESLYTVMYDAYIRGFGDEEPKEDLIELLS